MDFFLFFFRFLIKVKRESTDLCVCVCVCVCVLVSCYSQVRRDIILLNNENSNVQWALESITVNKASGGDGIPVELFQILKDDPVKVLHSTCQQIWKNSAVATGLEKVSFHANPKERQCQRMLKLLHNCTHLMLAK